VQSFEIAPEGAELQRDRFEVVAECGDVDGLAGPRADVVAEQVRRHTETLLDDLHPTGQVVETGVDELQRVRKATDRVVVLSHGNVIFDGPTKPGLAALRKSF